MLCKSSKGSFEMFMHIEISSCHVKKKFWGIYEIPSSLCWATILKTLIMLCDIEDRKKVSKYGGTYVSKRNFYSAAQELGTVHQLIHECSKTVWQIWIIPLPAELYLIWFFECISHFSRSNQGLIKLLLWSYAVNLVKNQYLCCCCR